MADNDHYLHDILDGGEFVDDGGHNPPSSGNSLHSDGYDDFSLMSIGRGEDDSVAVEDPLRPRSEHDSTVRDVPPEIKLQNENNTTTEPTLAIDNLADLPIPKGKSLAHHYFDQDKAVLCSFDIETGGEFCEILQISAQILCVTGINSKNPSTSLGPVFNEYVKPPDDALWDPQCSRLHGLSANLPQIQTANKITLVWHHFCEFINNNIIPSKACILVA